MISLTTIIIALVITFALLVITFVAPNPISGIMAVVFGALIYFVLWPKYEGGKQAQASGVEIQAAVQEVRHWNSGSRNSQGDKYEIIAVAPNPLNGNIQQFVSPPMTTDPEPYLGETVTVKVDWRNPKAYIMDVSFLPFQVH
ncbi:hypothetical protein [Neisseria animalis]|uniref:Uncharacterized protein n=1 Tax=Neisseria animalis TaxID=492 RepID=A0A5P3MTE6_NEIAN|nr:hypothetical protein [Neisseria animalis]QEY23919.1 hypothetical protein D0T90_04905 [Neisseria animalis]ROW31487.1 hypothetical protein CGZ60_10070 [Neisseria animalis]VEE05867.1 Uncharacterised protein [Neisseria animalis]